MKGVMGMGRLVIISALFLFLVAAPVTTFSQGRPWEPIPAVGSLSGPDSFRMGNIRILPSLKVGYKKIGFNVNLDIPSAELVTPVPFPILSVPGYVSLLDFAPLDARIERGGLLMGTARVDTVITPAVGFFGSAAAAMPRSVDLGANQGPSFDTGGSGAVTWTGSRMKWSEFEFGGTWNVSKALGIVAGLKFDHLSVRLGNPVPVPGYRYIRIFPLPVRILTANFPDYLGDLDARFTITYVGCRFSGPYFSGALLVGPAAARLRLPLELTQGGNYIAGPIFALVGRRDLSEQAEYTFVNSGPFFEASAESNLPITQNLNCAIWAKGSWLRIRGDGKINLNGQSTGFIGGLLFPTLFSSSRSGLSTLTLQTVECGVSTTLSF